MIEVSAVYFNPPRQVDSPAWQPGTGSAVNLCNGGPIDTSTRALTGTARRPFSHDCPRAGARMPRCNVKLLVASFFGSRTNLPPSLSSDLSSQMPASTQMPLGGPSQPSRRLALATACSGAAALAIGGLAGPVRAQTTSGLPGVMPASMAPSAPFDRRLTAAAQLMAGITPQSGDPVVDRLAALDAFREHQEWMRDQWGPVRARLDAMEQWRNQNVQVADPRSRTLLYPFSGPDFLNAYALFPNHARYVFFSLERPSNLPDMATKNAAEFAQLLASVRDALRDIFERNYFITSYMSRQLTAPRLRGTVPIIAVMMALNNRHLVSVEPVDLFPELTAVYAQPGVKRPRMPLRGVRMVFFDPATRNTQQLHYFSLDATDRALVYYPGFTAWLAKQGPATALVKSASYLLHDRQFSQVRDTLLATADMVLQDDTGVPFRVLRQAGWNVQLFGEYRKPIPALAYGFQRDLQESYLRLDNPLRLPFPFGYHWREGGAGSGLQIATRAPASLAVPAVVR